MTRIRALLAGAIALTVGAAGLAPAAAAPTPEEDVDTIATRLQEYYLGQGDEILLANGIYLARVSEALDYAESQEPDGSWTDVDYADRTSSANGSTWSAYNALYRMLAMAYAYRDADAEGFEDPALIEALDRALVHWDEVDPGNTNWWETEIGESMAMGRVSVFVGDELSEPARAASLEHNTGRLDPVGANGAWRTTNYLFEAVTTRDLEAIRDGFDTMVATVAVDDSGEVNEAVQPDASFWAHGAQLYSEGYGMALFTNVAIWADAARGTSLAFTRENLDTIAFYIINGTRWMIRGEIGMLYLGYRPPKTVDGVTGYAAEFLEPLDQMARTDALYATAYQALAANIRGERPGNGVTGHQYFWRSEFSSQLRDDYGIFTRLNSSRTVGAEYRSTFRPSVGNEVYWNSAGATAIQVTGEEYTDLGPAFDWFHYPGVTAPYHREQQRGTAGRVGNGGSFTGGVSDGEYGISVYSLDRSETTGSKSYFYFDDEMVALGAGIASTHASPVHSVVNQASSHDNASVDGTPIALGTADLAVDDASWAYNDRVGYVFPDASTLRASNTEQTGSWVGEDAVGRDAFTLYFDHGTAPSGAGYEYIVLPAATASEVEAYAEAPAVDVLRNDDALQAVAHDGLQRTMATFYEPGSLDLGEGRTLTVNQPAIVLLDESGDEPVATVANPDRPGLVVDVTLEAADSSTERGTFRLGSGAWLGKSVTAPLEPSDGTSTWPFTASSSAEGSDAGLLGDGDSGTSWTSADAGVQWITQNLGAGSFVSGVTLDWGASPASRFLVQTSTDGSSWTDQRLVQDADGPSEEVAFPPTRAAFVRVLLLEGGDSGYSVAEMSVRSSENIALGRSVTASGGSSPGLVTDGDIGSRWSGNISNDAWIQVDLGSVRPVQAVRLWWEASYARQYRIQVSDDGSSWVDVHSTDGAGSDGGLDAIAVDAEARYVRMQTVERSTTQYGVSVWEFEVFSDDAILDEDAPVAGRANLALGQPTTADSFYNDTLAPHFATDGITTTRWASARQNAPYTTQRWVSVDLGEPTVVNQAVISWEAATSNDFRVQGSLDGQDWQDLAHVTKESSELSTVVDFADTEARHVRVIGLPVTRYGMSIFELEVYGGYRFSAITDSVDLTRGGSGTIAASITPADEDDVFTAYPLDGDVAVADGPGRLEPEGRVEYDITGGEAGTTPVLLTHAKSDVVAWASVSIALDLAELEQVVSEANGLDSTRYTAASWEPVLPALEAAKRVLSDPAASTQGEADARAEALREAIDSLVIAEEPVEDPSVSVSGDLVPGGSIVVSGENFEPGATLVVELRSSPVTLGTATADAQGLVELQATIPATTSPGEHFVVVMLGDQDLASVAVTIAAAPGDGGPGDGGSGDGGNSGGGDGVDGGGNSGGGSGSDGGAGADAGDGGSLSQTGADIARAGVLASVALLLIGAGAAVTLHQRKRWAERP